MATETILSLPPKSTALKLITTLYPTPSIKIQQTLTTTTQPTLVSSQGRVIEGESTISEFLGEILENDIKWTPELRAETQEWLNRSSKFQSSPIDVYDFDTWMANRCFALRTGKPSWVDYFLYARIHPVVVWLI